MQAFGTGAGEGGLDELMRARFLQMGQLALQTFKVNLQARDLFSQLQHIFNRLPPPGAYLYS
ncbi:hypothetical protein [Brevibacillus sp. NSP2.1]|uniref:hypothetical protein n=1 Tax=Brevibacillus sp. NSP2.1 TaxID=3003229 RepID=UPI00047EF0D9|nr:hypothetical protein [Brevibacillus sp. NSP2.1]